MAWLHGQPASVRRVQLATAGRAPGRLSPCSRKRSIRRLACTGRSSKRRVQMFIGRILAVRNRMVDNLYIMDAPDITWENEYLDKVDRAMKKTFDVAERFRSLDYQLRENKENLELFAELLQFRKSNMLEWIIIGLILVEVIQIFKWW